MGYRNSSYTVFRIEYHFVRLTKAPQRGPQT